MQHVDIIRLSEKQKQQLITLKRKTGIDNWNVLCRWALCISLSEPTTPPKENIPSDSNIEMSWKTLFGMESKIYESIILFRYKKDLAEQDLHNYIKTHISRGLHQVLNYL